MSISKYIVKLVGISACIDYNKGITYAATLTGVGEEMAGAGATATIGLYWAFIEDTCSGDKKLKVCWCQLTSILLSEYE